MQATASCAPRASRNGGAISSSHALLIAQTQIRLIVEGYDPTIGIMHEKKALRAINPGFALDHMEPVRPVVDRAVLHLIDTVTFTGADFLIQHDGVCRMSPELARRVAQLALERCKVGNRQRPTHGFTSRSLRGCASDLSILQPRAAPHKRDDLAEARVRV